MLKFPLEEGLTFDDVVLVPGKSSVVPRRVDTQTQLTRNIKINIPLLSAAMDTVTDANMGIAVAREGGIGIIHRALAPKEQALEVDKVKKSESGIIIDPIVISPEGTIGEALKLMGRYRISGIPVTRGKKLVGIVTNRDLRFETKLNLKVSQVMTRDNLITVPEGTDPDKAKEILRQHRIEKLPVVDDSFELKGLITIKDIEKKIKYPNACKDSLGRLRVGAAVGVGEDAMERIDNLVKVGVDLIVVETAHGHSSGVIDTIQRIHKDYPDFEVVGGNVATAEGARDLIQAGATAIKVGVGPGSICTTRIVAGAGVPQLTAILNCAAVASKMGIPVIGDGGIKFSGDIVKALAAGADSVMIGSLFAGTEESPGEVILFQGRSYKVYRGMGSLGALVKGGGDRYSQEGESEAKLVPEGIEGRVPYKGSVSAAVYQMVGGLRAGMGYCGASSIAELKEKARFMRVTNAGLRESHVHDVIITREAPNYRLEGEA